MTTRTGWVQTRSGDWERYNVDTTTGIGTATGYTTTLAGTVNWPYGLGGGTSSKDAKPSAKAATRAPNKASSAPPPRAPFHGPTQREVAAQAAWRATIDERLWAESKTLSRQRFESEFGTVADLQRSGTFLTNLTRFTSVKDSVREAQTVVQTLSRREIRVAISTVTGQAFPAFRTDAAARKHLIEGLEGVRARLTKARETFERASDVKPLESAYAAAFSPENPALSVFAAAMAAKKPQPKMSTNLQELLAMA